MGDRVCFGSALTGKWESKCLFVFVDPVEGSMDVLVVSQQVTFEGAMEELITKGDEAPAYVCAVCKSRTSVTKDKMGNKLLADIFAKEQELKAKDKFIAQLQRKLAEALENQEKSTTIALKEEFNKVPTSPDGLAVNIKKSFEDALGALDGMEKFIIGTGVPGPPVQLRRKSL